jgi:O-methyltransferase involved in polyketide biosynthesis
MINGNTGVWCVQTMYLSAQAVDKTLDFIRRYSAPGSRVAFDYIFASVVRRENSLYGEQKSFGMVARIGESWTFGLEIGEIKTFLNERGFDLNANYTPSELEKLYLTEPDGTLHARINGTHCIVIASVN